MKISDITLAIVKQYLKLDINDDDEFLLPLIVDSAKGYIKSFTGLTDAEIDTKEDLTIAYLALVSDMYDNRSFTIDNDKVNKIIDSMLNMHSINLL